MDTPPRREILQEYEFELLLPPGHSATYFLGDIDELYRGSRRGLVLHDMRRRDYNTSPPGELTREIESVPLRKGEVFSIRKATLMDVQRILYDAAGLLDNFRQARRNGIRLQANRALAVTTREDVSKRIEGPFPEERRIHGMTHPMGMRRIETPRFQGMLKIDPVLEPRIISIILKVLDQLKVLELIKLGFTDKQTEFVFVPHNAPDARRIAGHGRQRAERRNTSMEVDRIVEVMHELRQEVLRMGIPKCGVVTNEVLGLFGY